MTASYRRPYLALDIAARRKGFELDVAAATDFAAGSPRALDAAERLDGLLPYAFDPVSERVLYTETPDMAAVLAAPFLYQGQYNTATGLFSVPLERLLDLETAAMAPTFVLSVSRCGTTLLAMLLRHVRCPTASEPDIFTQMAMLHLDEAARRTLIRGSTAALARQFGIGVIVKFRDHCNNIALALAEAVPEARMAFMLRDRIGWARSRQRAFNDSPQALADILKRGVLTFDALARAGRRPVLIWYEDLVGNPYATLRDFGVAAEALDGAGLETLMRRDAQAGTSLSQQATADRAMPDAVLRAFEAIWTEIAPRNVLRAHGMERLLPIDG